MCTSPLLIRNKKYRSLDVKVPNSFIRVPCGVCDECLRKRAKDLYVRLRFEAQDTFINGGSGFMCTLTYDDKNVPLLFNLGSPLMVFNKNDVIKFIKRLRTNLDRFFKKHYNSVAPDFKYLVTSEYGTNPNCSHRPHYHLIFLFRNPVTLYVFKLCFCRSLYNNKNGKYYFGKIYQCDKLDFSRGGLRYVSKYILKDQSYNNQSSILYQYIKFHTHYVNQKYGIIESPQTSDDYFYNKSIRTRKDYLKDVETLIRPYRHMLQFYMCSNDMGCSVILNRYGESLFSLGMLNIDGYPYSIPKAVVQRLERVDGTEQRDKLSKSIFMNCLDDSLKYCLSCNFISEYDKSLLFDFAERFLQPKFGSLYFVSQDFETFYDYPLIRYYEMLLSCLKFSNSSSLLEHRAKIAKLKSIREHENYIRKKLNKGI